MTKYVALSIAIRLTLLWATEQEMQATERQGKRKREKREVGRIGPPPWYRAALPTGRVWFSPGAPSAMHRRLETSLTNHIYIWKVRQLPRLRFTSSTLYESPRHRRPDWTIHPSTPSSLPVTFNYFRLIAPRSHELFSPIPLCCIRQHIEYRHTKRPRSRTVSAILSLSTDKAIARWIFSHQRRRAQIFLISYFTDTQSKSKYFCCWIIKTVF